MSGLHFIVNPNAGRGLAGRELPRLREILLRLNLKGEISLTSAPLEAGELAARAVEHGADRVVAVGGDGTLNEVVNGLAKAKNAGYPCGFGVIPVGSGNDLAKSLGLPLELESACEVLARGRTRPIDLGRVSVDGSDRYFVNAVGLGLDGEVALELARGRMLTGLAMYILAALKVVLAGRWPYSMKIGLDGRTLDETITLITVANGKQTGGGFRFTPDAAFDDGLLDFCYGTRVTKLQVLGLMPKILKGRHDGHPAVRMGRTTELSIEVPLGVPAHIDGEILASNGRKFTFGLHPGFIEVLF